MFFVYANEAELLVFHEAFDLFWRVGLVATASGVTNRRVKFPSSKSENVY